MKIKGLNLFLSIILVLSLVACGTPNTNKDLSLVQTNSSTLSTTGSKGDQSTIADNTSTQAETERAQSIVDESIENTTEVNNNTQNSDLQAAKESNSKEQVTQAQNNNSVVSNSNTVIDNVVLDSKQEEATKAPIVGNGFNNNATQTNSMNGFSFIESTGSFKNVTAYVQYLKDSGATYVSSTAEAVAAINNVCKTAQSGINLCFSDNVDTTALVNALPKDTSLSGYIDVNVSECEYTYTDYYFGAKFTWWNLASEESAVKSLVDQVLPSLNKGTTYNKITNVHDYICDNVNYCYETLAGTAQNFSSYDALIGHKSVCQGYALAFQKFMDTMGIPCFIAKGNVMVNGSSGPHAWNIVQLDGKWYSVDCTWDGQEDLTKHDYFLLGASEDPHGSSFGISLATSKYIN